MTNTTTFLTADNQPDGTTTMIDLRFCDGDTFARIFAEHSAAGRAEFPPAAEARFTEAAQWQLQNRSLDAHDAAIMRAHVLANTQFLAFVAGDDGTDEVDIRTLDADRLAALRADAVAHGDDTLIDTIDSL